MQTHVLLLIAGGVLNDVEQHQDYNDAKNAALRWVDWGIDPTTDEEVKNEDDDAHILSVRATPTGIEVDWIASY